MTQLEGKVALVTGASRGIGRAIALRLARDGATIAATYTANEHKAHETVRAIDQEGGTALALRADVRQVTDVRRLFDEVEQRLGALDIVVANAGVALRRPLVETTDAEFEMVMAVNVRGTFLCLREAARRVRDGGRIITISSNLTTAPMAGQAVYAASKAAVEQLTAVLARELGTRGVTVNAVAPGPTETDMLPDDARAIVPRLTALGCLGQPADIADVVAFLASGDARWITGQTILVTGGLG
jgi:3-oxoacyl-[acyl-carrier protein] reductase